MESLLKKEKKSSTCVDVVERRTLEIEDNIAILESIFQRNTQGLMLSEELNDLFNFFNRLNPFSLAKSVDSEKYLIGKLHSST